MSLSREETDAMAQRSLIAVRRKAECGRRSGMGQLPGRVVYVSATMSLTLISISDDVSYALC